MPLFKRHASQPATALKLRGGDEVAVVGEEYYQAALSNVCGGKSRGGHHYACIATLVAEPTNPHDHNAVAVQVDGMTVGYLSRGRAPSYSPVLRRLASQGFVAACDAEIRGGWDRGGGDQGSFGITLFLASPTHCHPDDPPPPAKASASRLENAPRTGASSSPRLDAGNVQGRHYTDWVEAVKDLKRLGHLEQARNLLTELCDAAEREAAVTGHVIPPWYFEQHTIVCRKLKDPDGELAILKRYVSSPRSRPGALDGRLASVIQKRETQAAMQQSAEPSQPAEYAAGWYQDPWRQATLRYYDGCDWTCHVVNR